MKTIFYSYPMIDNVVMGIDKLVLYKALTSYCDCSKTMQQIDKILLLQNQADRLKNLQNILNNFVNSLPDEQVKLIEYKYFRKQMEEDFDYTSRQYFRKQKKLTEKILRFVERNNMDEKWFLENFSDIDFLNKTYLKIKQDEKNNLRENCARCGNY